MIKALGICRNDETGVISVRSETNLSNDIWLVNQLVGRLNVSKKHIHKAMFEANISWMMEHGRKTGTWQAVKQANQDLANINITGDVGVVKEGRESLDDATREALRKKYGLTEKELSVQLEEINGIWQEPEAEEEKPDIFDENL